MLLVVNDEMTHLRRVHTLLNGQSEVSGLVIRAQLRSAARRVGSGQIRA